MSVSGPSNTPSYIPPEEPVEEPATTTTSSADAATTLDPNDPNYRPGRMTMTDPSRATNATTATTDASATTRTDAATTAVTQPPKASDLVPAEILTKYGLDPDKMTTESKYEGPRWDVGYYPYDGDVQFIAMGKHSQIFGHGAADAHSYFEMYSNPPSGLANGSRIADGYVSERGFEMCAGVDVTGDRPIGDAMYKAIRECGAPARAWIAALDKDGKEVPFGPGDKLVPVLTREDGSMVELAVDGRGNYRDTETGESVGYNNTAYRVKHPDGTIDETGVGKPPQEVLGLSDEVAFDFLDATGAMVGFNPRRDRIVESFAGEDGVWNALAKKDDGSFEHQVIKDGAVQETKVLSAEEKAELVQGKDVIHRIQTRATGELKGDGKVGSDYNMGWWGKCHNVACVGTSNMPRPEGTVRVVTNLGEGETLGLRFGDNVLKPNEDGTYTHEMRGADGQVQSSQAIDAEKAATLAAENKAGAVIIAADGGLKKADVTTVSPSEVEALVCHIGDGAVVSKGGDGSRYYNHPDILVTKDGRQIMAHIKEVKTEGDKTESIGYRSGAEFHDNDRSALRAPGMESRLLGNGYGRQYAFNVMDMGKLNEHREDDIEEFVVVHPDGREETIKAEDVDLFAWENKFDFRPDQIWNLHKTVTKDGSTVIERDPGSHVWNYTIHSVDTAPVDPKNLSSWDLKNADKPGMMTGTTDPEGKHYFRSHVDGESYTYWVRFDEEGEIEDYAYLSNSVPDFVWTQHVKNAYEDAWTGESQAPGVMNSEIQRLYLASLGALEGETLPGGFISTQALKTGTVEKPAEE